LLYELKIDKRAHRFYRSLDEKSRRIVKDHLDRLKADPFPGSSGDKEKILLPGGEITFRMHIGRTFTAFYDIDEGSSTVFTNILTTIEEAHKRYGRWA
jgi:mRNA-degrading endonuclease RelE of RelBE toxin-antitoxin system